MFIPDCLDRTWLLLCAGFDVYVPLWGIDGTYSSFHARLHFQMQKRYSLFPARLKGVAHGDNIRT